MSAAKIFPFIHQKTAVKIDVPGNKLIEEFLGRVSTGSGNVSVAHMIAPSGWSEPPQTPQFDEITIMIRGTMRIETTEGTFDVGPGEVFFASKGHTLTYSNPFPDENEYWAVCLPAFSPDLAGR